MKSVLEEEHINIAVITEHWLGELLPDQLNFQNFYVGAHFSRKKRYRGAFILVHKKHLIKNLPQIHKKSVEGVIEISGIIDEKSEKVILAVYRPPQGSSEIFIYNEDMPRRSD
ncbi:hypothetical protein HHI36_010932 [Cryptolaemus montrouzieri]|uniref:Uncharacterized protein n=1 Tax=Cryptolaemus montrouzieri TaxID=559131 RepID=A0ABD2MKB7_9CUCU